MSKKTAPAPAARKPRSPGRIRAIFLAVVVHVLFFGLIVFGVSWQSTPSAPVEAELWDKLPATKPSPPQPRVEPAREEPKPQPLPPPKPEPVPPKEEVKPEPPKPDPAIALKAEREKRDKEKRERLEREKLEKERVAKKDEETRKKREKEEAEKKKREDDKRRKDEEIAKAEAAKAATAAASARQTEIDAWKKKIQDKIRGAANVPDTVTGNPTVTVQIRILPGGEVLESTITKRSGNASYDAAIERAIRSASPLPVPPPNSELFPQFRDLNLQFRHER